MNTRVTILTILLACLSGAAVGGDGSPEMTTRIQALSGDSFEERQAAAEWLATEAARLEGTGARRELAALMEALRRVTAGSDDAEACEMARKVLSPFLAGNCRWTISADAVPGPVTEVLSLPEGVLLANCTGRSLVANLAFGIGGEGGEDGGSGKPAGDWIVLFDRATGKPLWETRLEGERILEGSVEVVPEGILVAGIVLRGGEEEEQIGRLRFLDRATGKVKWTWETGPLPSFTGGVNGVRPDGDRLLFLNADLDTSGKSTGRIDCYDRTGDPGKPAWSLPVTGGVPQELRIVPSREEGRIGLFWTPAEAVAFRIPDGKVLWRRPLAELGFSVKNVLMYGFNLKSAATPEGLVLAGSLPPDPVAGTETSIACCLALGTGKTLWKTEPLPGFPMRAGSLAGGFWAGGSASGELEGPWWMGLYDAATGKPRWETKNVVLLQEQFPVVEIAPDGILAGLVTTSGLRMGAFNLAGKLPVRFHSVTDGKLLWERAFEVPPKLSRVVRTPEGVLALHAKGVSLYRLTDADAR